MSLSRRALVVGGTSGIGQGIAMALAKRQYEVTLVGRSEKGVLQKLEGENHTFVPIDAFDLSSVKDVADRTKDIDVLVMTQGMATIQGYTPTKHDRLDEKLQLHYFSRIYLSILLAPKMKKGSRILSVLAAGLHPKYKQAEEDFELKNNYSNYNAANASCFYNDAGFDALAERHPGLVVVHAAPGFVNTNWGTEMPWIVRTAIRPLQAAFGTSFIDCGETLVTGLLKLPSTGGFYLMDRKGEQIDKSKGIKHTRVERDMIWEKTLKVLPDILQ